MQYVTFSNQLECYYYNKEVSVNKVDSGKLQVC